MADSIKNNKSQNGIPLPDKRQSETAKNKDLLKNSNGNGQLGTKRVKKPLMLESEEYLQNDESKIYQYDEIKYMIM